MKSECAMGRFFACLINDVCRQQRGGGVLWRMQLDEEGAHATCFVTVFFI